MKKQNPELKAEKRALLGKKVKRLRAEGIIPSTLYGKGMKSESIQLKTRDVEEIFAETGEAGLVDLMVDKEESLPILLRNPQYGVVSDALIHIDCYKVDLKEKIIASVPIELVGVSQSVKDGNSLMQVTDEIEVEALPTDLPEKIEVDLGALKTVEDTVTVADLKIGNEKVEIKNAADQVIVKTEEPREEEVIEEVVTPGEVPATEQKEGEEGVEEGKEGQEEEKKDQPETGKDQAEGKKEEKKEPEKK